jgi:ABC-2 type transport system permease protein
MTLFLRLALISVKQQMTYRIAMAAGFATNLFFALLRVALMQALYASGKTGTDFTLADAVTFAGLSQALIAGLTVFGSYELMQAVYSGAVGSDLLKPMRLFTFYLAKDVGKALVNLLLRGALFLLVFGIFFPVLLPPTLLDWLAFCAALVLGFLVSFTWRYLVNLAAFWTPDAIGVARIAFTLSQMLGGFFMPLRMLPGWFAQIAMLTPFPALTALPVDIWLGKLHGVDLLAALGVQLLWLALLFWVCQLLTRAGVRRLVIQGG